VIQKSEIHCYIQNGATNTMTIVKRNRTRLIENAKCRDKYLQTDERDVPEQDDTVTVKL
jgi:hypothetical protein